MLSVILTDYFCTCHIGFHALVQYVKTKRSSPALVHCGFLHILGTAVRNAGRGVRLRHWQPHVKLRNPVLQRIDWNYNEDTAGVGVTKEDVDQ